MCREAVQKDRFLVSRFHQLRAHRESAERALALLLFLLLPHRRPNVGVDDVRSLRRLHRITQNAYLGDLLSTSEEMVGRLIAFRTGEVEVEPKPIRRIDP